MVVSQSVIPFSENRKWGYKKDQRVIIKPEYDTAFIFNKTNEIALVANKSEFNKIINPLSGEEEYTYDYFYIDSKNNKIKLLAQYFPDSLFTFPDQQELKFNYRDSSNYFKILFQSKLYLFSKKGKQLSSGFDNINETNLKGYFETENYSEFEKKTVRIKGLIDSTGLVIIKCKYHQISINKEDSSIYCCSAVYNNKLNDDVFNCKGKLIYTSPKHIEFSSKTIHVMKSYEPNEIFIIENSVKNISNNFEGNDFYYLQNNKALVINKNNWYVFDLISQKKQKVDKESYFRILLNLTGN